MKLSLRSCLCSAMVFAFLPALFAERVPGRYIVELTTESVSEHVTRLSVASGMRGSTANAHRISMQHD